MNTLVVHKRLRWCLGVVNISLVIFVNEFYRIDVSAIKLFHADFTQPIKWRPIRTRIYFLIGDACETNWNRGCPQQIREYCGATRWYRLSDYQFKLSCAPLSLLTKTACTRLLTPSFRKILLTWSLTVPTSILSDLAISLLVFPSFICARISNSLHWD